MKYFTSLIVLISLLHPAVAQVTPPAPYGALPSPQQVDWQQLEYYMFIHFGHNTFTDVECGRVYEDPEVFNPHSWMRISGRVLPRRQE